MGIFDNYVPETREMKGLSGDFTLRVTNAQETISKSGKSMLKIELEEVGTRAKLYHFIVSGEYFNSNLTKFLDCFQIQRDCLSPIAWTGALGVAKLRPQKDDERYTEIHYLQVDPNYLESMANKNYQAPQMGYSIPADPFAP